MQANHNLSNYYKALASIINPEAAYDNHGTFVAIDFRYNEDVRRSVPSVAMYDKNGSLLCRFNRLKSAYLYAQHLYEHMIRTKFHT